jgi:putative ABC transport system permease protein
VTWTVLRTLFRASARDEAEAEIAFHIEERTRELVEQGVEPARARQLAEERFGPIPPVERALEDSLRRRRKREERSESIGSLTQDLRYGVRGLRRNPVFATAAVATLALGLGATLAVFNVVNGVLLRPLPYQDPHRITMIWIAMREADGTVSQLPLTSGFFADIERDSRTFEAMAAFRSWSYAVAHEPDAEPELVAGARVSPALFDVLGIQPAVGRAFTRAEAVPGGPNVAVISHHLWQRRFGGERGIVGRQVSLNGASFTVTGVMPPHFAFPRGAELPAPFQFGVRTDVWTPLVFDASDLRDYGTQNLSAVGRLSRGCGTPTGCTASAAQGELTAMMKRFLAANAPRLSLEYRLVSMADQAAAKVRRPLLILLGAAAFVLLIAAANVTGLLVARLHVRRRELAVRAALGAARSRIARQLVTENVVLCALGTVLGLAIAYWGTQVMVALVPGSLPRADDIALDWRVLSAAGGLALATAVGFGVAGAYTVRWGGAGLLSTLHAGDARAAGSVRHRDARRLLVVAEVALSLTLLIGAALLTRSLIRLQQVRPGFDPARVLTATVSHPIAGRIQPAVDGPRWVATFDQVTARLASASGIAAAGAVSSLPVSGAFENGGVRPVGRVYEPGQGPTAQYGVVAGDYFGAAGIRLLAGRKFDASDADPTRATMIVNRLFARAHFGSETNALGREVTALFEFTRDRPPRTIVGVVDDVKQHSLDADAGPQVYVPVTQFPYPRLTLVVRVAPAPPAPPAPGSTGGPSGTDPLAAAPLVRQMVRDVNPAATVHDVRTMESVVSESLARQRFNMTLIGTFAAVALVLAIVGLYGVLALIVGQRRREIGVRLALGASPGVVVRMVLGEGARVAAAGVVVGLGGAFALTRVLESLLYGIGSTDAITFAGAAGFVATVALAATWLPARRAARVDPRSALAAE